MPLFLIPILAGFRSVFSAVLTFCSKPPGSWIAAALACALGLWWFGQHEVNVGKRICNAEHAEAAANEIARLGKVYVDADTRSTARTDVSEKKSADNQKVIVYVKEKAAAMAGASDVCVPSDIADRLRDEE